MNRRTLLAMGVATWATVAVAPVMAESAANPDQFIETLSAQMLDAIKADAKAQSGDLKAIGGLVEKHLMPNVDFVRMTALSVGRPWREATPAQKDSIMKEYKLLLIRTYAGAFSAVKDMTIKLLPSRSEGGDDVVVRSEVAQPRGEPIQLDYRLARSGSSWKVYDVNVLGVWLVQTYRNQFGQEINRGGLDGLIKSLAEKNRSAG